MAKRKAYITKNYVKGWKVILLDGRCVECTNTIFNSHDVTENGLKMCRDFCIGNNLEVIRECQ